MPQKQSTAPHSCRFVLLQHPVSAAAQRGQTQRCLNRSTFNFMCFISSKVKSTSEGLALGWSLQCLYCTPPSLPPQKLHTLPSTRLYTFRTLIIININNTNNYSKYFLECVSASPQLHMNRYCHWCSAPCSAAAAITWICD